MGRCVGSACSLRAHLQMWDPQRGFPRDLNKGETWSVNKRLTLVLVPCIQASPVTWLRISSTSFLLYREQCLEHHFMPWWGHGGNQCVNIDIRWLLATLPVITQFIMPALTATFYWCTCVNTTQNESLTLGTCTNYLSHLVCQGGIGHIWQSYWVSAPGIWNHYSLYWIHSPAFGKKKIYFTNKSLSAIRFKDLSLKGL